MQQILALAAAGEMDETRRERLAQFFDAQHARLFRFAVRVAGSRDEALDLVQEAFLRAARNVRRFPERDDEAIAWMLRTIVNLLRDRYRRQRVRDLFRSMFVRRQPDLDEHLTTASAVRTAVAGLPPRQRAVIALCELEGSSTAAAAAALGIAESTVRWHLAEARKRLATILGEQR